MDRHADAVPENLWVTETLEEARAYDARKESGPFRFSVALKRALLWRLIEPRLPPPDRETPILDLGGGTGVWAIRLAEAGHRVTMLDIAPGYLARAREKIAAADLTGLIAAEQGDICDLSRYAPDAYPVVLALGDPLSYCHDAERALGEILRVTRPGGVLIADVENRYAALRDGRRAESWQDASQVLTQGVARWQGEDDFAPIRAFTPSEIRGVVEGSGWRCESAYPADVLASIVERDMFEDAVSERPMDELVALEERLREDASLLGCGTEIQFVARNPEASERKAWT